MYIDKTHILIELQKFYSFTSSADFARHLDITPQNLSQWIKRNTFDITKVAMKCPEINPNWLLTGEGEMLKPEKKVENISSHNSGVNMNAGGDIKGNRVNATDVDRLIGEMAEQRKMFDKQMDRLFNELDAKNKLLDKFFEKGK